MKELITLSKKNSKMQVVLRIFLSGYLVISFKNIKIIRKERSVTMYSAIWIDGYLKFYNEENNQLHQCGESIIALKESDNGKNISDDFLDEV